MTDMPSADHGTVRDATAGERVAVTVHVKTVAVKDAKDAMAPGPSPVTERVIKRVKAVGGHGVVAAVGVVPGGIAQIVPRALMRTASLSHWTRLPQLA